MNVGAVESTSEHSRGWLRGGCIVAEGGWEGVIVVHQTGVLKGLWEAGVSPIAMATPSPPSIAPGGDL